MTALQILALYPPIWLLCFWWNLACVRHGELVIAMWDWRVVEDVYSEPAPLPPSEAICCEHKNMHCVMHGCAMVEAPAAEAPATEHFIGLTETLEAIRAIPWDGPIEEPMAFEMIEERRARKPEYEMG